MWPDQRILDLFGIELPIIQAPMAGAMGAELVIAVCEAGGLGSLPCAMLAPDQARAELGIIRQRTSRPVNVNFFCHDPPRPDVQREAEWRARLAPYYTELGVDPETTPTTPVLTSFNDPLCQLVEEVRPEVVSFHFGLPEPSLLERVKATGAKVISSATTAAEAEWLEDHGCDAIIAQGLEAGGHRGMFLSGEIATQPGTLALVPQVVDRVKVPVIAAGGIGDPRAIAAAFALGAAAVQIGTAYLFCPESKISASHRARLRSARDDETMLTNVFTGRPARCLPNRLPSELGPIAVAVPDFPLAAKAIAPLRATAEARGSGDFSPLLAGQAAALGRERPAADLTRELAAGALQRLGSLSRRPER
jgi:nitronate monooxygenase